MPTPAALLAALEHSLSPETVFLDAAKPLKNFPHTNLKGGGEKERQAGKPAAKADQKLRRKTRPEGAIRRRRAEK